MPPHSFNSHQRRYLLCQVEMEEDLHQAAEKAADKWADPRRAARAETVYVRAAGTQSRTRGAYHATRRPAPNAIHH